VTPGRPISHQNVDGGSSSDILASVSNGENRTGNFAVSTGRASRRRPTGTSATISCPVEDKALASTGESFSLLLAAANSARAKERDKRLEAIDEDIRTREADLRPLLPALKRSEELLRATPADLSKALPAGTAFVDVLRVVYINQAPKVRGVKGEKRTPRYVAFVETHQGVKRIELGKAESIEELPELWRRALVEGAEAEPGRGASGVSKAPASCGTTASCRTSTRMSIVAFIPTGPRAELRRLTPDPQPLAHGWARTCSRPRMAQGKMRTDPDGHQEDVALDDTSQERSWLRDRPGWRDPLIVAGLFLLAAGVFLPTVRYDFVGLDDPGYVYENPHVREGLSGTNILWAFGQYTQVYLWLPLTWLSLQLDATLFGPEPAGFHFTNTLLHAFNAALVFLVLRRMTGAVGRSALVALLFALHPLRVESVAWVTERKDVLSLSFALLAMLAYHRSVLASSRAWLALAVGLYGCGLAAKPMVITLPCVLLLLDWWPLGRLRSWADLRPLLLEKVPFFLLAGVFSVITIYSQQSTAMYNVTDLSLGKRIAIALVGYASYLGQTFWPFDLAALYQLPEGRDSYPWWQPVGAAGLLVALTGIAWRLRRPAPYLLVGWLWFLGGLLPVSGLFQAGPQARADRFTYLPHIGLFLALVWVAADLVAKFHLPRGVVISTSAVILAALVVRTSDQLGHWRNNLSLWQHTVAVTENNPIASLSLAVQYEADGELEKALHSHTKACRIDPTLFNSQAGQARVLVRLGQLEEAARVAEKAIDVFRQHPKQPLNAPAGMADCWYILGKHSEKNRRPAEAIAQYRKALEYHPAAHIRLAAIAHSARPNDPGINFKLGVDLMERGEWKRAVPLLAAAVEAAPRNAGSRGALATALFRGALATALLATGQEEEAATQAQEAVRLEPRWPAQAARFAWLRATHPIPAHRRGEQAYWAARAASLIRPISPETLDALAAAAAETGRFDEAVTQAEQAMKLAQQGGKSDLAAGIGKRLALYRRRQAYHRPAPLAGLLAGCSGLARSDRTLSSAEGSPLAGAIRLGGAGPAAEAVCPAALANTLPAYSASQVYKRAGGASSCSSISTCSITPGASVSGQDRGVHWCCRGWCAAAPTCPTLPTVASSPPRLSSASTCDA
jgi:tetratricopeptide (TPR) repeat protein